MNQLLKIKVNISECINYRNKEINEEKQRNKIINNKNDE